ncbi:MAG TPA: DUF2892 domain-containing protein [Methanotrichaceae archaeon]|nr:DUF2892 domain-containing protein [Methanotrichaceae archaeon]
MKNLGTLDRLLRVLLAEICFLAGFFWLGMEWQIPLYLIAAVLLLQAASGACGIYSLIGINTCERIKRKDKNLITVFLVLIIASAAIGGYLSSTMTRDIFLQNFESIKEPYRAVLSDTSQGLRDPSISDYERLNTSFLAFNDKYKNYRPLAIKSDGQLSDDLVNITVIIRGSKEDVFSGDLSRAHSTLQKIDPILQGIMKRNRIE